MKVFELHENYHFDELKCTYSYTIKGDGMEFNCDNPVHASWLYFLLNNVVKPKNLDDEVGE